MLSKSVIELCRLEIPTVYDKISSLFDAALKCCSIQTNFQYYEVCADLCAIALLKTGDILLLQKFIEFTSLYLLPFIEESADTISLLWKCLSDVNIFIN